MSDINISLKGKTFVFTGSLDTLTRSEASQAVRNRGGAVSNSVSKNTDYVVAGEKPGSKKQEAKKLAVEIIDEAAFQKLLS
jgi:DNA ligase (NAD+)